MVRHLDSYLSATQLGITLASLALGWIGEPAFAWIVEPVVTAFVGENPALVHSAAATVAFLTIMILHIVLGELAPKSVAIRKAEATTLFVALPLYVFYKLTYPAIWMLNHTANFLLKLVGIAPVSEGEIAHDEEELRLLLATSHASHLSIQKRELLDNIFELSHRMARQIMLPRQDVVYLSTTRSLAENMRIARRSGHTRFPLCEGDLDHVVGRHPHQGHLPPRAADHPAAGRGARDRLRARDPGARPAAQAHAHRALPPGGGDRRVRRRVGSGDPRGRDRGDRRPDPGRVRHREAGDHPARGRASTRWKAAC